MTPFGQPPRAVMCSRPECPIPGYREEGMCSRPDRVIPSRDRHVFRVFPTCSRCVPRTRRDGPVFPCSPALHSREHGTHHRRHQTASRTEAVFKARAPWLEPRWLTWPSTARVAWSTTLTRWTEQEGWR